MNQSEIERAMTKCIVWFYDKNCVTFYSRDGKKKNMALGIRRLEKMLMETFKGKWETAIIYENQEGGEELAKYKRGVRV